MTVHSSMQIQSVLFHNEPKALFRSLECVANSIKLTAEAGVTFDNLRVYYGDASPEPVLNDIQIASLTQKYKSLFNFEYTFFNENTGTAKGHNYLAASNEYDYLMIMNPDILVSPRCIEHLIKPQIHDSNIAITEAKQMPLEHPKAFDEASGETAWASTACVIISMKAFKAVKGFDADTFFMYCDDVDFSWRVRLNGYKVIYCANAPVFHAKNLTSVAVYSATDSDKRFSAEAHILMAHKWSYPKRVKALINMYSKSDEKLFHESVAAYKKREASGKLPTPIDPEHRVSKMYGDCYATHRY